MKPFSRINRIYSTNLSKADINEYISKQLTKALGVFAKSAYYGKLTTDGFNIVVFKKTPFQTKVIAKINSENSGSLLNIQYKLTVSPLVLLVPMWTFFIYCFFAPSFTINGKEASLINKSIFILFGLAIFTTVILIVANYLGYQPGSSCVVSTFRLSKINLPDQYLKLSIHELGHTQGLPHCPDKTCFMRDAEGKNHTNEETGFCPKCKAVLIEKGWVLL